MDIERHPRVVAAVVVVALVVGLLTGCLSTQASAVAIVGPPEAGVTGFGRAIAMDEGRLVVRANRAAGPVVYVYDAVGAGWSHSATITPQFGHSSSWGLALAVSGDTIGISDRGRPGTEVGEYGALHVYQLSSGTWSFRQQLSGGAPGFQFGETVALSGDGLATTSRPFCYEYGCTTSYWHLYQRYDGSFRQVFTDSGAAEIDVGVDAGRFAVATPGRIDSYSGSQDNRLRVIDTNVVLPAFVLDEHVPAWAADGTITEGWFRKADLAGDVLAFEHCCSTDQRLNVARSDGSTFQTEATFPLTEHSRWLSVLPGLVLVADSSDGVWHTYAAHDGGWQRSSDLAAPDAVAGQFATEPVAVGDRLAVAGDGVVHVMTLEVVDLRDR